MLKFKKRLSFSFAVFFLALPCLSSPGAVDENFFHDGREVLARYSSILDDLRGRATKGGKPYYKIHSDALAEEATKLLQHTKEVLKELKSEESTGSHKQSTAPKTISFSPSEQLTRLKTLKVRLRERFLANNMTLQRWNLLVAQCLGALSPFQVQGSIITLGAQVPSHTPDDDFSTRYYNDAEIDQDPFFGKGAYENGVTPLAMVCDFETSSEAGASSATPQAGASSATLHRANRDCLIGFETWLRAITQGIVPIMADLRGALGSSSLPLSLGSWQEYAHARHFLVGTLSREQVLLKIGFVRDLFEKAQQINGANFEKTQQRNRVIAALYFLTYYVSWDNFFSANASQDPGAACGQEDDLGRFFSLNVFSSTDGRSHLPQAFRVQVQRFFWERRAALYAPYTPPSTSATQREYAYTDAERTQLANRCGRALCAAGNTQLRSSDRAFTYRGQRNGWFDNITFSVGQAVNLFTHSITAALFENWYWRDTKQGQGDALLLFGQMLQERSNQLTVEQGPLRTSPDSFGYVLQVVLEFFRANPPKDMTQSASASAASSSSSSSS